jgi:hypothetical protein
MKTYRLKEHITKEMLKEKGFTIEKTYNALWAVRGQREEEKEYSLSSKMIIIKLEPPERVLKFRFQSSEEKYNLLEEAKDIIDWLQL